MKRPAPTIRLHVERLEDRATPAAMTPSTVRHAYGFDQIVFNTSSGAVAGDGRGQTIAIVDAYNDPFVAGDLDAFDRNFSINGGQSLYTQYGAATSFLTVAAATGIRNSAGWSGEIALDVEWAHAIAPAAKVLLVEARTSGFSDLLAAVNYARSQPGVVAVSMSWGSGEFSGETSATYQSYFTTPAGHAGVTFVGASGDGGAPAIWPAVSTNVLGVGGTALNVDSLGNYRGESGWSGSGGGSSSFFSKPAYQTAYAGATRGSPDVAYDAAPNTGFYVYNSYDGGWEVVGGTSAGAPQWAALLAIADQGRAISGVGSLDGVQSTLPAIYILPQSDFHDVTTGSNGLAATAGYDLVTGRGSPRANLVVRDLVGNRTVAASMYPATPGGTGPTGSLGNMAVVADSAATTQAIDAVELRGLRPATAMLAATENGEVPWRAPRSTPDWLTGVMHAATQAPEAAPDLAVFAGSDDTPANIDLS